MGKFSQWFYNGMYRFTTPDWDTGIPPLEVTAVSAEFDRPGRALDLGCGTGTSSIYLAQHGWQVTGIDFSPKAIALAQKKAGAANVAVEWRVGDATRLDFLRESFDLILDVGCFHGLKAEDKTRYGREVMRLARPGSTFLLFAFAQSACLGRYGVTPDEAHRYFTPVFNLVETRPDQGRHQRATVWYKFRRSIM